MSTTVHGNIAAEAPRVAAKEGALDNATVAFGQAAVVAIIFNTLLAWVKDAYDPLNTFMAHLTGHHWITHGLVDLAVFFGLGFFLMSRHSTWNGMNLVRAVAIACVVGAGGLALWFLVV
jgi:hypothetical protein